MSPTIFIVLTSLVVSVLGTVYVTQPTGSTTFTGGQQATVKWQDDGVAPVLSAFGASKVSLCVGNTNAQTLLQLITDNVDVSKVSTIQFTTNPGIGPDGGDYFIRFESLSAKDPKEPQYPALSFSSKFTLTGMSGSFNASIQAEIDGLSTAPLPSQTSKPSLSLSSSSSSSSLATSTKLSSTSTGTATASSSTGTTNAAVANIEGGSVLGLALAAIVGGAALF